MFELIISDMDDLGRLKKYEREIEQHEKALKTLREKHKKLNSKISFDMHPEGDPCGAYEGDKVMILREGKYKGKVGIVHERTPGATYSDNGKSKSFVTYEVMFPDNTVLTFISHVLKKIDE